MKYFAKKGGTHSICFRFGEDLAYEITHKYAKELYKQAKPGFANLEGIPNFHAGKKVTGYFYTIWGEITTNQECFRRRLKGELAIDILDKRINDG